MVTVLTLLTATIAVAFNAFVHSQYDRDGWKLRFQCDPWTQTGFVGEDFGVGAIRVTVTNATSKTQRIPLLTTDENLDDLRLVTNWPNLHLLSGIKLPKPVKPLKTLDPSESISSEFKLANFGISRPQAPGSYTIQMKLTVNGLVISSPPTCIKIHEISKDIVLQTCNVTVAEPSDLPPDVQRAIPLVQQVLLGSRVYLVYRSPLNSQQTALIFTCRITSLKNRVFDLKVEGSYGDDIPLTITYRESSHTKFTTKHVINSIDGNPWTAADEKYRQEKIKREGKLPPPEKK